MFLLDFRKRVGGKVFFFFQKINANLWHHQKSLIEKHENFTALRL
jgi:hypothetical protein